LKYPINKIFLKKRKIRKLNDTNTPTWCNFSLHIHDTQLNSNVRFNYLDAVLSIGMLDEAAVERDLLCDLIKTHGMLILVVSINNEIRTLTQ